MHGKLILRPRSASGMPAAMVLAAVVIKDSTVIHRIKGGLLWLRYRNQGRAQAEKSLG